jgi:Amt family ammonium transporter
MTKTRRPSVTNLFSRKSTSAQAPGQHLLQLLLPYSAMQQPTQADLVLGQGLDTMWLLVTGIGILFMQVGILAFLSGNSQAKNVKSIVLKSVLDHSVGSIGWVLLGWGLFQGDNMFAAGAGAHFYMDEDNFARMFQQFGYCATAASVVSGAVMGRCRVHVYLLNSFVMTTVTYPIMAHWAWNPSGFLAVLGYKDFAGSGVVHIFGGTCALVAAWACGPRVGRFGRGGGKAARAEPGPCGRFAKRAVKRVRGGPRMMHAALLLTGNGDPTFRVRDIPGHSAPLVALGALLLYVAWFSFNAGSSATVINSTGTQQASRAVINTLVASGAGLCTILLWGALLKSQGDITFICNGLLSALVSVTASCGFVDVWAAIVVGILSVPTYVVSAKIVMFVLNVDDPINAAAVHMCGGLLGVLWLGLTHPTLGLFYSGNAQFLGAQALGALCIWAWALVTSLSVFFVASRALRGGISYPHDEQLIGLDFIYFGGSAYPDLDLEVTSAQVELIADVRRGKSPSELGQGRSNSEASESSVHTVGGARMHPVSSKKDSKVPANFAADALDIVLADDTLRKRFRQYLSTHHMDENVRFWDATLARQSDPVPEFRATSARAIILMFIADKAPKQINLASVVRSQIIKTFEENDPVELGKRDLFDGALQELYQVGVPPPTHLLFSASSRELTALTTGHAPKPFFQAVYHHDVWGRWKRDRVAAERKRLHTRTYSHENHYLSLHAPAVLKRGRRAQTPRRPAPIAPPPKARHRCLGPCLPQRQRRGIAPATPRTARTGLPQTSRSGAARASSRARKQPPAAPPGSRPPPTCAGARLTGTRT